MICFHILVIREAFVAFADTKLTFPEKFGFGEAYVLEHTPPF